MTCPNYCSVTKGEVRASDTLMIRRCYRWALRFGTILIIAVCTTPTICMAQLPSIWFAPRCPYPPANVAGAIDLMDLFRPDAPWKRAAVHISVLKLPTQFLSWVPDSQLVLIIRDLNRRGIALAVEALAQNVVGEPACGQGVEGYGDPGQPDKIAEKIKRLGGQLAYVAMDEPLFFGRFYEGPTACHSSVENIAHRVAAIVGRYRLIFPNIQIGDIEPAGAPMRPGWDGSFNEWLLAFHNAVGVPIAFLQVDVDWNNPNHIDGLKKSVNLAAQSNLSFGVIYNGRDDATSDAQWIDTAKINIVNTESVLKGRPAQAIFQSWVSFPARLLPETNPKSLTYLIDYYLRAHPSR